MKGKRGKPVGGISLDNPRLQNLGKTGSAIKADKAVTDTKSFQRWFGDSKVVDKDGKPLVVYHGTRRTFTKFDLNGVSKFRDEGEYGRGFYFAPSPEYASMYVGETGGERVLPVYLSIKKPFIGESFEAAQYAGTKGREALIKLGYDGVIVINPKSTGKGTRETPYGLAMEIVAFYPNQIKSVIGNTGEFDPNDDDIGK